MVDASAQQQLVERDNGLVREVQMLRQHITNMYQAWMTGKAPPLPPPIFLVATLAQTPNIAPDDPPYSPDAPAYHVRPNDPSNSITQPSVTTTQDFPPVISITLNNGHPLKAQNAQYHSPEVAHRVFDSYKKIPQDELQARNEQVTGRDGMPGKLKSMDSSLEDKRRVGGQGSMTCKELIVPHNTHLPAGFKLPNFNLYDGRGDPVAHLRVYCNEMRSVGEKDDVMMAYFSESLTGAALDWHNRQNVDEWLTLSDMDRDFVRYFQCRSSVTTDHTSLSKMEKRPEESFNEFGLRWREQVARVRPPISEEEMVKLFIQAQGPTYYSHLIPALGKPFNDVLKMGELVEEGIKSGKIVSCSETIQNIPVSLVGRKRNGKDDPIGFPDQHFQPRPHTRGYPCASDDPPRLHFSPQKSQSCTSYPQYPAPQNAHLPPRAYQKRRGSGFRPNQAFKNERLRKKKAFTPLGESYAILFQKLRTLDMLKPIQIKAPNHPPKKFDPSQQCAYCSGAPGHDIEKCWNLNNTTQKLIDVGNIVVQSPDVTNTGQYPTLVHKEVHVMSIIDCENEPAEESQKQFVHNNVIKPRENSSNLVRNSVAKMSYLEIGKTLHLLEFLVVYFVVISVVRIISGL